MGIIDPDDFRNLLQNYQDDKLPDDYMFDPVTEEMIGMSNKRVGEIKDVISRKDTIGWSKRTCWCSSVGIQIIKRC